MDDYEQQIAYQIVNGSWNRHLWDHYPKYVVTLNEMDTGIDNGIKIVHLADFLTAEQW